MIALGWTWAGARLPNGVAAYPIDSVSLLAVPRSLAADARARMAWQISIVESGTDLLPVAPAQALHPDQLADVAPATIRRCLADIAGDVQYTLSCDPDVAPLEEPTQGRAWLVSRQIVRDRAIESGFALKRLAALAEGRVAAPRQNKGGMQCDVLVSRVAGPRVALRIARASQAMDGRVITRLTLTGPWPAYGFSAIPQVAAA